MIIMDGEHNRSMGGLPHSPQTEERKKSGATGDRTQGLWLKLPALCHCMSYDTQQQPPLSLSLLLLCS